MKTLFTALGLIAVLALGGCDPQETELNPEAPAADDVPEGGPEAGGQGNPEESLYEEAVPEYEERESGEMSDGDA